MLCKELILPRDLGNSINMEKQQRPAPPPRSAGSCREEAGQCWELDFGVAESQDWGSWGLGGKGRERGRDGEEEGEDEKVEGWGQGVASATTAPRHFCACCPLRAQRLHGKSLRILEISSR